MQIDPKVVVLLERFNKSYPTVLAKAVRDDDDGNYKIFANLLYAETLHKAGRPVLKDINELLMDITDINVGLRPTLYPVN